MRSYGQFCALARALDLVGQRWTLLVVRELLLGPRRYGQLLEGLPGIGTNLLAQRLRELEDAGVLRRTSIAGDARGEAYELTDHGRALDSALVELARWGMSPMHPPAPDERRRPGWYALALRAAFRPERGGRNETYELTLDGETFHLDVRDGAVEARDGGAREAAVRIRADTEGFLLLATGARPPAALEREGRVRIDGDRAALKRWLGAFRLPVPVATR